MTRTAPIRNFTLTVAALLLIGLNTGAARADEVFRAGSQTVATGAQQRTVPERASILLLGMGLAGAAAAYRRRSKKTQN